jgi:hypothetical protein
LLCEQVRLANVVFLEKMKKFIDPLISPIVEIFNANGCTTTASCQGHAGLEPYVSFYAEMEQAVYLAKALHQDSIADVPQLLRGWSIQPAFDERFKLRFIMRAQGWHQWWRAYFCASLGKDSTKLPALLQKSFDNLNKIKLVVEHEQADAKEDE